MEIGPNGVAVLHSPNNIVFKSKIVLFCFRPRQPSIEKVHHDMYPKEIRSSRRDRIQ